MTTETQFSPEQLRALDAANRLQVWIKPRDGVHGYPYLVMSECGQLIEAELNACGESAAIVQRGAAPDRRIRPFSFAPGVHRAPLTEYMFAEERAERMREERPAAAQLAKTLLKTRTDRLLHSFASTTPRPEHINHGDEGPYLRDLGLPSAIASKLVAWGEARCMVCTFEDGNGNSRNQHCWRPEFLAEACEKHLELFGSADLPEEFIQWAKEYLERTRSAEDERAKQRPTQR